MSTWRGRASDLPDTLSSKVPSVRFSTAPKAEAMNAAKARPARARPRILKKGALCREGGVLFTRHVAAVAGPLLDLQISKYDTTSIQLDVSFMF